MPADIRTTLYLKAKVYRALKVKAATTDRSICDLVNAAVVESLRGDAMDLEAFDRRAKEPSRFLPHFGWALRHCAPRLSADCFPIDDGLVLHGWLP